MNVPTFAMKNYGEFCETEYFWSGFFYDLGIKFEWIQNATQNPVVTLGMFHYILCSSS